MKSKEIVNFVKYSLLLLHVADRFVETTTTMACITKVIIDTRTIFHIYARCALEFIDSLKSFDITDLVK